MEQKKRPAMAKQGAKPPAKPGKKPTDSLLGWFGRQVGHVKKAVNEDVTRRKPTKPPASPAQSVRPEPAKPKPAVRSSQAPARPPADAARAEGSRVIYREDKIEEADLPDRPGVRLRRTIIDEVVVVDEKRRDPPGG